MESLDGNAVTNQADGKTYEVLGNAPTWEASKAVSYTHLDVYKRQSVFSLEDELPEAVQFVSCGGRHPRDFAIVPGGKFLLVANRFSNNLICFRLGGRTGRIKEICDAVTLNEAVSIVFDPESTKAEESYEGK